MLRKILKVFLNSKLIFKTPKNCDLIVFDDVAINELKLILKNRNYFLLKNRYENIKKIYISFNIILNFIKYFRGNLNTAYLASIIYTINPKVVLTIQDNSPKFHDLAKLFHNKVSFIAIQQAVRNDAIWNEYDFKKKLNINKNKNFFLDTFLTFGKYEKDLYSKLKIKVKKFHIVGCLKLANFFYFCKKKNMIGKKEFFDICLISDHPPSKEKAKFLKKEYKNVEQSIVKIVKHTIKFCKKNKKSLIFSTKIKSGKQFREEMQFYKNNLSSDEFQYLVKNMYKKKKSSFSNFFQKDYSSYFSIFESRVAIGMMTSMLREKLALGGKILACNFTNLNIFDFPIKDFLFLKETKFDIFEKRLMTILKLSEKEFFKRLGFKKNYVIVNLNESKTIYKINKILDKKLA